MSVVRKVYMNHTYMLVINCLLTMSGKPLEIYTYMSMGLIDHDHFICIYGKSLPTTNALLFEAVLSHNTKRNPYIN